MMHTQNPTSVHSHPSPIGQPMAGLYALPDFSVVQISGTDAVSFIQGQITNDIAGADQSVARLAGYCTAQGRLLATLVMGHLPAVEQEPPALIALLRQDIVEPVLKRLKMFVMRAKVSLSASPMSVSGVSTTAAQRSQLEQRLGHSLPDQAWQTQHHATGIWIAAPSGGITAGITAGAAAGDTTGAAADAHASTAKLTGTANQDDSAVLRWWWLSSPAQQAVNSALLSAFALRPSAQWQTQDIAAGLPWIEAATQDLFIPQTLNLDLIEGVSFTKGCYPGQEIVARSHYRGTIKRRMAYGTLVLPILQNSEITGTPSPLADQSDMAQVLPGADMYDRTRGDQPCGRIVNVATFGEQTFILFEVTFEALDHQALSAASAAGPVVTLHDLPYSTRAQN